MNEKEIRFTVTKCIFKSSGVWNFSNTYREERQRERKRAVGGKGAKIKVKMADRCLSVCQCMYAFVQTVGQYDSAQ